MTPSHTMPAAAPKRRKYVRAIGPRLRVVLNVIFLLVGLLFANGAYLGVGVFDRIGDAGDLLRHGALAWHLWAFGAVTGAAGLGLWHRLGPHFGLGSARVGTGTGHRGVGGA